MPQADNVNHKARKYSCSNPNCKRVFSRPKIIKYYVCPTCQTLVDNSNAGEFVEKESASTVRKVSTQRKPKILEPEGFQELKTLDIQVVSDQTALEERSATSTENKIELSERVVNLEQVQTFQQKPSELASSEEIATVERKKLPESSLGCKHVFGYLGHRGKGEKIPDACIECSVSLKCLLSDYYRSGESVKEISKWYTIPSE